MIKNQFESSKLATKLRQGSLALFPTDTLPALGACPKYSKTIWDFKKTNICGFFKKSIRGYSCRKSSYTILNYVLPFQD